MLETLRPRLAEGVKVRRRADGSWGLQRPDSARQAELAPDQDTLFALIDGRRSLSQIAEAHLEAHRFVPFSALRDLLRTLALRGLLAHSPEELARAGLDVRPPRSARLASQRLFTAPLPLGGVSSILVLLVWLLLAAFGWRAAPSPLSAYQVLLAYVGAAIALTARGFAQGALLSLLGRPPERLHVFSTFFVVHLAPDVTGSALLDRPGRVAAALAALLGSALAALAGASRPGLLGGALAVLLLDLCPFAPTSFGRLLAALAGRVDLREHARAYLSRRLLRRLGSAHFFEGEWSLVTSSLLSLAWICLLVRLLLTRGLAAALELLAFGLGHSGADRALAFLGAFGLALLVPLSLGVLLAALARAVASVLPARARPGEHTGAELAAADLDLVPIFARLSREERDGLAQASRELRFAPGERIVVQGEPGDAFYAIREGEAAVERESESGLSREVARLGAGDCFGELALLERTPRTATVRAIAKTVVLALSHEAFGRLRNQLGGENLTALLRATAGLHQSPLFSRLAAERLSALAMQLRPLPVKAGAQVVIEGEAGDAFYLVESGRLEVVAEGRRISELGPGAHFGEIALLREVPRTATVRALEDSLLLVLGKKSFLTALASDLALSSRIEELAAERASEAA